MFDRLPLTRRLGRGGRRLRIAYGRIFHEANAFSPLTTEREDFERFHLFEGRALAEITALSRFELKGYLRNAELSGFVLAAQLAGGVETVPLRSALTVPSGPLSRAAFDWLVDGLVERLTEAGPLDGLYLALHGSMRVRDLESAPEEVILARIRERAPDLQVAVSLDLHANLSAGLVDGTTLLCGYRTNPHRDPFPTGFRAGRLLIRTLRDQVRPVRAWRKLPLVLGGGVGIDFLAPMRPVFRRLRAMAREPNLLDATLLMVHPYSDASDLGWAVHITADDAPALAEAYADEIAERAWAVRKAPLPEMYTISEALQEARRARLARRVGAVSLVDVGDIVGTGSPGGNTHLLHHLTQDTAGLRVYVPLHDPEAVDRCDAATPGTTVEVVLRGTPGLPAQPEVPWRATVRRRMTTDFGRTVLLEQGQLHLAITERPPLTLHPAFWRGLGLEPRDADAIVQKSLFHYRMFYALVSARHIPVVSPGPSSLDNARGLQLEQPTYPMHDPADWREADRRFRGIGG